MIYKRRRNFLEKLGSVKFLLIGGLAFLVFISIGLSKEIIRRHQINQEIGKIQKEIDTLGKRNQELSSLIDYLSTESFKEIQARQELGYQKAGETAVSVQPNGSAGETVKQITQQREVPNPQKWWNYFFASK